MTPLKPEKVSSRGIDTEVILAAATAAGFGALLIGIALWVVIAVRRPPTRRYLRLRGHRSRHRCGCRCHNDTAVRDAVPFSVAAAVVVAVERTAGDAIAGKSPLPPPIVVMPALAGGVIVSARVEACGDGAGGVALGRGSGVGHGVETCRDGRDFPVRGKTPKETGVEAACPLTSTAMRARARRLQ